MDLGQVTDGGLDDDARQDELRGSESLERNV